MHPGWNEAPCGLLRVGDDGGLLAANRAFVALLGLGPEDVAPARVDALFRPGSRLYYQMNVFPSLRLAGAVEEVYLEFQDVRGGSVPALVNLRRDALALHSDWAVMRVEQRGRWEAAVVEARRVAEHEAAGHARKNEELARAKAELEEALRELRESHWMLRKVADVLPSCMYCGRVKPGERDWESASDFLRRNSRFLSHGCCPGCVEALLRDIGGAPRPDAEP